MIQHYTLRRNIRKPNVALLAGDSVTLALTNPDAHNAKLSIVRMSLAEAERLGATMIKFAKQARKKMEK